MLKSDYKIVFISLLLILLNSCSEIKEEKKFTIGFSQCCDDAWRDVMNSEMRRELSLHPEIDFQFRKSDGDSREQIRHIKELIENGIDLLLVAPNEAEPLTPIIEEVYQSGIPVVLIDRKTESELYTAYIGANNYEIGQMAADYIGTTFRGNAQILEIQLVMSISPAIERHRGFIDALSKYPKLKILNSFEITWDLDYFDKFFPEILSKHPNANIIFAHTDLLAERAHKIARKYGRADSLFFVGIDGIPGTGRGIQAVEDGILDASMLYPTGGGEAIRLAISILNNLPYEKENTLETIVIDEANARILHNQMKKVFSLQENIDEQLHILNTYKLDSRKQRIFIFVLVSSLILAVILGLSLRKSLLINKAALRDLEFKNQEITKSESRLIKMSEKVKSATQAKIDFFTNVSHEFRTPLTLILGFTDDILPSKVINKRIQQSLKLIHQNAHRLLRLVNQLMDFRKVESNQMKLRASENDLISFIKNVMESFSSAAERRGIDFVLLTRFDQLDLWFDIGMMDKVLFNLLSNAFKFTPDGGKIHISISEDKFDDKVTVIVEDSGTGLSKTDASRIFEPFFQGENQQMLGTGLGLSLSKSLVEMHAGEISVQSSSGKGSRFIVSLPFGKKHLDQTQIISDSKQVASGEMYTENTWAFETKEDEIENGNAGQQILLIEDNKDIQEFLKNKLSNSFQLVQAYDGKDGLDKAKELIPDLVISDIMLPSMDGLEITRALKTDLRTSHIPIILLSARSSIDHQIEGMNTGADAYITKPFNVQFLFAKIKSLLLNRQVLKESFGNHIKSHEIEFGVLDLQEDISPIDLEFLQKFNSYIYQNYTRQEFQVTDLCEELNLSRSQLYRKVKALIGEGISDYIQRVRLSKAEELLIEGKLSVSDIAYTAGYSSPDYFSTVFRSKYGTSPSAFRKNH